MSSRAVLPAFSLRDDSKADTSFPSGRPSLICFVKEDCPTCNDAIPLIDALHRGFGEGVDVGGGDVAPRQAALTPRSTKPRTSTTGLRAPRALGSLSFVFGGDQGNLSAAQDPV